LNKLPLLEKVPIQVRFKIVYSTMAYRDSEWIQEEGKRHSNFTGDRSPVGFEVTTAS